MTSGVSTRNYESVIGEMAETVGVSKSSVSREFVEASAKSIEELTSRPLGELDILIVYLDGVGYGDHHVIAALGVDRSGKKHVLGLTPGASENLEASTRLLEDLVDRGLDPEKRYLFVLDGAKALRSAVRRVFGTRQRIQRCRLHKMRNVLRELPKELGKQVASVMKAAFRMEADEGLAKLKKQAEWLETEYPGAAASLREGLDEMFTVSRMGLSCSLTRCVMSTNIIESPFGTVQQVTERVRNWKNGKMVTRWAASALLKAEKSFRRIMGYKDLWQLEAALRDDADTSKKRAA
jgi:transposase-like protein